MFHRIETDYFEKNKFAQCESRIRNAGRNHFSCSFFSLVPSSRNNAGWRQLCIHEWLMSSTIIDGLVYSIESFPLRSTLKPEYTIGLVLSLGSMSCLPAFSLLFCQVLYNIRRCSKFCYACFAVLLQMDAIRRLSPASAWFLVGLGQSLHSDPLHRRCRYSQNFKVDSFDLLRRSFFSSITEASFP